MPPITIIKRTSLVKDTTETHRNIEVTVCQADMEAAIVDWAKRHLNFNPPEGAGVSVRIHEEGSDDHGNEGESAYATLTVRTVVSKNNA